MARRRTLRRDLRFEHRYLTIRVDSVRETDGAVHEYIVGSGPEIAYAVPIWPDGTVTLNRQVRHGMRGRSLEVPGGHCDAGEDPAKAARRELLEETGIAASRITPLLSFLASIKVQQRLHVFAAEGLRQRSHARDGDEDIETIRIPLTQAAEWALTGRIRHGPSIVAVLAAARHADRSDGARLPTTGRREPGTA